MPLTLDRTSLHNRILACWLGKNIGGTLGAPMEWKRQRNHIEFYQQELKGEPLPNDDLDIQLAWLLTMEKFGIEPSLELLSEQWCIYVAPHWCEYGIAKVNLRAGIPAPLAGNLDNPYRDSCGSFIRSEIWACTRPGLPDLAAIAAARDSMVDHGTGEGTHAAVFVAALQSAAFVITDLDRLVEIGLSYIPADCGVAKAVHTAVEAARSGLNLDAARDRILQEHRGRCFLNLRNWVSPEDTAKGFAEGKLGYDVPSNIAILVYGLLAERKNFGKMLCTIVNMGEDTDCTAATAGALWGILHGTKGIPENWITPIGRGIKTVAINRGDAWTWPENVDDLAIRTLKQAERLAQTRTDRLTIGDQSTTLNVKELLGRDAQKLPHMYGNRLTREHLGLTVHLDFPENPHLLNGGRLPITVRFETRENIMSRWVLHWHLPSGVTLEQGGDSSVLCLAKHFEVPAEQNFVLTRSAPAKGVVENAILQITSTGRPFAMAIAVPILGG